MMEKARRNREKLEKQREKLHKKELEQQQKECRKNSKSSGPEEGAAEWQDCWTISALKSIMGSWV